MSNLSTIMEKNVSKLLKKYFAFYAFNDEQFNKGKNVNFYYVNAGNGLMVPDFFAKKVNKGLNDIYTKSVIQHQATESKKDIIWSSFANYEAQISGDCDDTIAALGSYDSISKQDILDEYQNYYDNCVEHDYF